ncbi:Mdm1p [Sporobolomyces salmoneus]|uniref:Mdm1p n=1 Tax=Sporobolomyces salmoneus TaxID=183962 RepID=UPI00317059A1
MSAANKHQTSWWIVVLSVLLISSTLTSSLAYYIFVLPLLAISVIIAVPGGTLWLTWRNEGKLLVESGGTSGKEGRFRGSGSARRRTAPPLYFTSPAAWAMTQTKASWESSTTDRPTLFPDAPPFLAAAIQDLLSFITRDFIVKWYSSMSDSPVFPNAVEQTISETLVSVANRVSEVDWSDVLVGRILPLLTSHLDTFPAAEQALRRQDLLPESDELDLFLASRYSAELKSGKLHQAVDVASPNSRPAEEAWLRSLFGKILPLILPEREMESPAVAIMVREIVACAVMLPVFDMLGDPDFWNRIIDDKAGNAIRDQKMVNQFREALDKQAPSIPSPTSRVSSGSNLPSQDTGLRRTETISVRTGQRQFDAWLKGIGKTKNLADAKRLRSDLTGQIRKAKGMTEGRTPEEIVEGVKIAQWNDYIDRLQTAKRKIDQRIEELGGTSGETRRAQAATIYDSKLTSVFRLRDILRDPTSLSYFMEFEERRKSSERVQFWLLVEGLKDPLEEQVDETILGSRTAVPLLSTDAIDDLRLIWESYLSRDPFKSSSSHLNTIRSFVEQIVPDSFPLQELRRVRYAIFAIQTEVLETMEEEEFPSFVASDLYFKAIANLQLPSASESPLTVTPSEALPSTLSHGRRRSLSNPIRTSRQSSIPLPTESRQARTPSPAPHIQLAPTKALSSIRTETLPPQVTFKDPFDSPKVRRTGSENGHDLHTSRKTSSGSLDTQNSTSSGAISRKGGAVGLSDSLEFLMTSPTPETQERSPLFDEVLPEQSAEPDDSGEPSPNSEDDYIRVETIEAIQDALNSILETNAKTPTLPQRQLSSNGSPQEQKSLTGKTRRTLPPPRHPSLSSFPASNPSTSHSSPTSTSLSSPVRPPPNRTVSSSSAPLSTRRQKAVFEDAESLDDLELDQGEADFDPQSIKLAAPGDLNLPAEIRRLAASLEKLKNQESVVGALIRKAELTGNASELKLLVKSQDSLRREIRAATFQKDQYENQEAENKLTPTGTRVIIPGTTVGQAEGQNFQLYLVEVHQVNGDGSFRSGWIVTRRYSEFASLYSKLKDKFVPARYLDFPSKRIVTSYSKEFIEQRRIGLERYLQALIKIPVICRSQELRAFLSQQTISLPKSDPSPRIPAGLNINLNHGFIRTFYRSVTSGIDDVLGTSTTSMMDTIVERLSQQAAVGVIQAEDLVEQTMSDTYNAVSNSRIGEEGLTYFTAPICDLFVTVFELREKNNWLRRQAILIVLQQVLGGAIERKFRDSVKMLLAPTQLVGYIASLKAGLWPDGQLKPKTPPRTAEEKLATKESANRKLSALMPDVAANLIGRHNARNGARTLFAILQNKRLLKHLIFSIVDEVVAVVFPEITPRSSSATPSSTLATPRPLFVS